MVKIQRPPKLKDAYFNAIFYGLTDAGKTHLLGTSEDSEETSPTLFIDLDGGVLTLAGRKTAIVRPKTFDELQELYDFLRHDNDKYRSVCIDTLTEQQKEMSMGTLLDELDDESGYSDLGGSKVATLQDWQRSGKHMRKLIRAFRDLSYHPDPDLRVHVFMTAAEKTDERRDIGCPSLPGQLGLEVGGYVDVLARLILVPDFEDESGKEVRYLHTRKHLGENDAFVYLARNRLRLLPKRIKNPSIPKLMKYWKATREDTE